MRKLTNEAKIVFNAYDYSPFNEEFGNRQAIAAALKAAVNEVLPEYREHRTNSMDERYRKVTVATIRDKFFAIIDLLNGYTDQ